MPGLVDCHTHPSQFFQAGVDYSSYLDFILRFFIPGETMFDNTTYVREESMRIVVCGVVVCPFITMIHNSTHKESASFH